MFVREELNTYYELFHNPETRPLSSAVHSVFFMEELRRYITRYLGPDSLMTGQEGEEEDDDDEEDGF